jgi:radical SAM superfamily enzyme with C-terminal helix-hairpin-helix motif
LILLTRVRVMDIESEQLWLDVTIITHGRRATHLLDLPANRAAANAQLAKTVDHVRAAKVMAAISNRGSKHLKAGHISTLHQRPDAGFLGRLA